MAVFQRGIAGALRQVLPNFNGRDHNGLEPIGEHRLGAGIAYVHAPRHIQQQPHALRGVPRVHKLQVVGAQRNHQHIQRLSRHQNTLQHVLAVQVGLEGIVKGGGAGVQSLLLHAVIFAQHVLQATRPAGMLVIAHARDGGVSPRVGIPIA